MAQLLLCLILTNSLVILITAEESGHSMIEPDEAHSSNPLVTSQSKNERLRFAEAPSARKLGKHLHKIVKSSAAPSLSPYEVSGNKENVMSIKEVSSSDQNVITVNGQAIQGQKNWRHHSIDRSVVGGGVILGGLVTTFLVTVFRYIRITRRKNAEPNA